MDFGASESDLKECMGNDDYLDTAILEIFESSPKQSFKLISRLPRFVPKDRIILFRFFTYCNTYIICKLT